ncbi:hypothetical protein MRS44_010647 [Fusarium solani]|uniref:uncharacterized protein n=1 Tax=Fusarium solani TaxID=169388 RepID=UPI0032C3F58E|nr:hypothetical protein MRS44_010647 [Fusarium solani]
MSDPPSARISRASSTVPDVAGKLGFVSMVTDACAGDAILVCPGRGAPSTVPFRWQKRPLPSVSQSRRITLFEIGPVNLLQKRRSDEPSKMKKSPHLRQINMDCFGVSSTSHSQSFDRDRPHLPSLIPPTSPVGLSRCRRQLGQHLRLDIYKEMHPEDMAQEMRHSKRTQGHSHWHAHHAAPTPPSHHHQHL